MYEGLTYSNLIAPLIEVEKEPKSGLMENSVWLEWSHFKQREEKESTWFSFPFSIIYVFVLWI